MRARKILAAGIASLAFSAFWGLIVFVLLHLAAEMPAPEAWLRAKWFAMGAVVFAFPLARVTQ